MTNKTSIFATIKIVFFLTAIFWVVEFFNYHLTHELDIYGIFPRNFIGLRGIFLSPFIHGSVSHLLLNTLPFLVLGFFVALNGRNKFIRTTLFIVLYGGLGVWLFGRPNIHIGASSLIFGYFGYLVGKGIYERSFSSLLIAVITIFLYGGMIWGIFPHNEFISWEGHLFGLISGIFAAKSEVKYSNNSSKDKGKK